jgi:hypothetical protein
MHAQVRNVIDHLRFTTLNNVLVELSAGESTPLGSILSKVYYQTNICDVIDREYRSGYPHNGGMHTFTFLGPKREAVSMLELIKEVISEKFKLDNETIQVLSELSFVSQEILKRK